jgi:transposase
VTKLADSVDIVIGVDTHKHTHTASFVAPGGGVEDVSTVNTTKAGYVQLLATAQCWPRRAWAIEGTASYGAGLVRVLLAAGEQVIEIDHPKRLASRNGSKTDTLDATRAAREALEREQLGEPRAGGDREALRVLHSTRSSAVHARTQAMNAVHALVVGAPDSVRDKLCDLTPVQLLKACSNLRVRTEWRVETRATVTALRCCARRTIALDAEAAELEKAIAVIVERVAPQLIALPGVGPITGAVILCAWSHPGRCRSEAAFAMLAGASPIPASSGMTTRHRLNRGGDRQLNRALHTIVISRIRLDPTTKAYVEKRTSEGKTIREIRRSLKRYIARDLYRLLEHPPVS